MKSTIVTKSNLEDYKIERLPKDWRGVSLKETILSLDAGVWGDEPKSGLPAYPVLRSTDVANDGNLNLLTAAIRSVPEHKATRLALRPGDIILIGSSGSSRLLGRAAIFRGAPDGRIYLFSNFMLRIRSADTVIPQFLYYCLNSSHYSGFLKFLQQTSTGLRNLPRNELLKFVLPLPKPVEQRKIAEILSTADDTIQKTDEVITATERLKRGLMQRLLTRGTEHTKVKETLIGEVPQAWEVVELGNALTLCQYGLSVPLKTEGTYPILRMNNLGNGCALNAKLKFADLPRKLFDQFKLERGDILFNRTNSIDLVGKVGIFTLDGDFTFASYLIRLRADGEKADPGFINYYLNWTVTQRRLKELATRAASQANINASNLRGFPVPLPPLPEQRRIVAILSEADEKLYRERTKREALRNLKNGLMQKLLTGQIRVKEARNGRN